MGPRNSTSLGPPLPAGAHQTRWTKPHNRLDHTNLNKTNSYSNKQPSQLTTVREIPSENLWIRHTTHIPITPTQTNDQRPSDVTIVPPPSPEIICGISLTITKMTNSTHLTIPNQIKKGHTIRHQQPDRNRALGSSQLPSSIHIHNIREKALVLPTFFNAGL